MSQYKHLTKVICHKIKKGDKKSQNKSDQYHQSNNKNKLLNINNNSLNNFWIHVYQKYTEHVQNHVCPLDNHKC